jgi:hypothetical protein
LPPDLLTNLYGGAHGKQKTLALVSLRHALNVGEAEAASPARDGVSHQENCTDVVRRRLRAGERGQSGLVLAIVPCFKAHRGCGVLGAR